MRTTTLSSSVQIRGTSLTLKSKQRRTDYPNTDMWYTWYDIWVSEKLTSMVLSHFQRLRTSRFSKEHFKGTHPSLSSLSTANWHLNSSLTYDRLPITHLKISDLWYLHLLSIAALPPIWRSINAEPTRKSFVWHWGGGREDQCDGAILGPFLHRMLSANSASINSIRFGPKQLMF